MQLRGSGRRPALRRQPPPQVASAGPWLELRTREGGRVPARGGLTDWMGGEGESKHTPCPVQGWGGGQNNYGGAGPWEGPGKPEARLQPLQQPDPRNKDFSQAYGPSKRACGRPGSCTRQCSSSWMLEYHETGGS